MESARIEELLYQTLQTEMGAVEVFVVAINCAVDDNLRLEWQRYLDDTRHHLAIMRQVFAALGIDPDRETPGRAVVRSRGDALVDSMTVALASRDRVMAQLVAAEAVVGTENRSHANWGLIGRIAAQDGSELGAVLEDAHQQVGEQKARHLYHTMGWARELWIESLGLPAVLPPPEDRRDVSTAIGASRAEQGRGA